MGAEIPPIRDKNSGKSVGESVVKWPKVGEYKDGNITIKVYKEAYLTGYKKDETVRPKGKG